jgi:hypothetical protein
MGLRPTRSEESPHLTAQSVRKTMPRCFAEFTLSEANGLSMTGPNVVLNGICRSLCARVRSFKKVSGYDRIGACRRYQAS